jgi:spore photoproduct lyase
MIRTVYVEHEVAGHPRARRILERFAGATVVPIERYGEVFNRNQQSFRLQKIEPSLILARKMTPRVLPTPGGYGIGGERNYYFSHVLNCLYDCRYCFLQGMFRSAHYVLFVNYEDFQSDILELASTSETPAHFFSGYDGDSLALESWTGFVSSFVPFFAERATSAFVELRTKSVAIRPLIDREPAENVVVAFSFTPTSTSESLEKGVPSNESRIEALARVAAHGYPVGLRFDPLIYRRDYESQYRRLFDDVFGKLQSLSLIERVHSVSLGPFRLPRDYFRRMARLYPEERLFAGPLVESSGMVSYPEELEQKLRDFCMKELRELVPEDVLFPCHLERR